MQNHQVKELAKRTKELAILPYPFAEDGDKLSSVLDSRFYSRFYKEHETASRAFRVLSLGYNKCAAKLDYTGFLHRHPSNYRFSKTKGRTLDSLVIVHVVNGHGHFRSEMSGEIPIPANSVFFVFPGVTHYYRYDDETGWDEEWVELDPTDVLPLLAAAGITPKSPLRTFSSITALSEAFQNLLDASHLNGVGAEIRVAALAHLVVAEAIAAWRKGTDAEGGQGVERMRQALVADIGEPTLVRDAARRAGKSVSRMRDLFRQATGLSPKKYQMRARLVRAGKLLRETDLPIGTIAEQTGFESIFAFSKRFKKLLGFSPSEYRQRKELKANQKGA